MSNNKLKQCPKCAVWFTAKDFRENPEIKPLGMTFEEGDINHNLFYFNHACEDCGTTFTLKVNMLAELIESPKSQEILAGSDKCESHCLDINDTNECGQECKYAPFRKLLNQMMNRWMELQKV